MVKHQRVGEERFSSVPSGARSRGLHRLRDLFRRRMSALADRFEQRLQKLARGSRIVRSAVHLQATIARHDGYVELTLDQAQVRVPVTDQVAELLVLDLHDRHRV